MSIGKKDLEELKKVQKLTGFKSRSKMLRSAIQSLAKDYERIDTLKGNVEMMFVLTYPDTKRGKVSDALHKFEDDVSIGMHHHHPGVCVDILILHSSAERARRFFNIIKKCKSIKSVTYIVV